MKSGFSLNRIVLIIKSDMSLIKILWLSLLYISFVFAQVKIICIGDSNTGSPGQHNDAQYPSVLQKKLNDGFIVENYGYAGATLTSKGERPYIRSWLYDVAKFASPDIVIILLGTNDTDANYWEAYGHLFSKDYSNFIKGLREISDPQFLLGFPPPLFNNPAANSIVKDEIIPAIKEIAKSTGTKTVNFYDPLNDEKYFPDGTHINEAGFKIMANIAYDAIMAILDDTPPEIPSGLNATASDSSITLSWDLVDNVDIASYLLFSGETDNQLSYRALITHPVSTYIDTNLINEIMYFYSIAAMDQNGNMSAQSNIVNSSLIQEQTADDRDNDDPDEDPVGDDPAQPFEFALVQNYPNPFNPYTRIRYSIPNDSHIEIKIYDAMGAVVRTLVNRYESAGFNSVLWDGKNDNGFAVGTGIYIYRLVTGEYSQSMKMVLMK